MTRDVITSKKQEVSSISLFISILFIFGYTGSLAAHRLSPVVASRGYSLVAVNSMDSRMQDQQLWQVGSIVAAQGVRCPIWNITRPGNKSMSPALAGGSSTILYQVFLNVLVRHTQWQNPHNIVKQFILQLKIKFKK